MKYNFDKIIKAAKNFSLSSAERNSILSRINTFVENNPLGEPAASTGKKRSWYKTQFFLDEFSIFTQRKVVPVYILLIIMLAGGTSAAAYGALPGNVLYPIKIHVNENVESFFSTGEVAKAKIETEHATNRLIEAERLAAQGKLTAETRVLLENNFTFKANGVSRRIANLKEDGELENAAMVSSNFEGLLSSHRALMLGLANEKDIDG